MRSDERAGARAVDLRAPVLAAWIDEMERKSARTVWTRGGCVSWYLDAQRRNTAIWPDHRFRFRNRTRRFDPAKYELNGP